MPAEIGMQTQSSELGTEPEMCASQCKFFCLANCRETTTESVFWEMHDVRLFFKKAD